MAKFKFPLWLTPVQMVIIPISDKFNDYATTVYNKLKDSSVRVKMDSRNEKMGAKIRDAELNKIPIMVIIGENEVNNNTLSIRRKFKGDLGSFTLDDFIQQTNTEISTRSLSS